MTIINSYNLVSAVYDYFPNTSLQGKNHKNTLMLFIFPTKKNFSIHSSFDSIFPYEKVSGNYKEMHGLMVNYEENPKCADITKKLKELYDDAVVLATSLITEYPVCMHGKCILSPIYNYSFGGQYIGGAV